MATYHVGSKEVTPISSDAIQRLATTPGVTHVVAKKVCLRHPRFKSKFSNPHFYLSFRRDGGVWREFDVAGDLKDSPSAMSHFETNQDGRQLPPARCSPQPGAAASPRKITKDEDLAALVAEIGKSLPGLHGYEKGFKDALESVALALTPTIAQEVLSGAIATALDAYGNNVDNADGVTVNLNVFDAVGNVVDGTTATLSVEQLSGIVDHASQLILIRRDGQSLDNVLDELDEALSVADV